MFFFVFFFLWERSPFIFRLKNDIKFSGKRNIIFPDDTKKIIFQCNIFWKDHLFRTFGKRKYFFLCSEFVFLNGECGNLKVVNDGEELTRNINQKKNSNVSQEPVDVHTVTNVGETVSSITRYKIVKQLGKYYFSCGLVLNNLKDKKLFFDQTNRNRFDLISARRAGIAPLCRI